jgi:hypothetical protein
MPVVDGSGAPCPVQTDEWVGAIMTLNVTWAPVTAVAGGTGNIYLWTLNHYMIDGSGKITGTSRTCGTQTPPIVLNSTGLMVEVLPAGTMASILNELPTKKVWDNDTRTATVTGMLGGWNVMSSTQVNPTLAVSGLSTKYQDPTVAWPSSAQNIPMTDLTDDDMDGNPGITAYPLNDNGMGYYLPGTVIGGTAAMPPPHADKLFIVSRTQVSLYGMSTSCKETKGTITVPEYDLHVVGCHDVGMPGTTPCTSGEVSFLDGNVTVYSGMGGPGSTITGTFDSMQLGGEGGTPTCDDVIAAFPPPTMYPQGDF